MNPSYLMDSSVLVLFLKQNPEIVQRVANAPATYMSTVALGELFYGAEHAIHVSKSLAEVKELMQRISIIMVDDTTASIYGHLKHEQRMKGQMIPDNDLWIASTAIQYNLTLAARDQHFNWISGLALEQW